MSALENPSTQSSPANEFLRALFGDRLEGGDCLCIRALQHGGGEVKQEFYEHLDELATDQLQAWNQRLSIYFGTALRDAGHPDKARKAGCRAITALWADLDAKDFVQCQDPRQPTGLERQRGKKLIREALQGQLPSTLQPSILVDTGGGYQAYWLLRDPIRVGVDGSVADIEDTLAGLHHLIGADPARKDVTSVMRLPGTVNMKYDDRPVCRVIGIKPKRRYSLADFAQYRIKPVAVSTASPDPDAGQDFPALVAWFKDKGWYLRAQGEKHLVACPWKDAHTVDSGSTETALYTPSANNGGAGGFKCQHGHCAERRIADVYALLKPPLRLSPGWVAADPQQLDLTRYEFSDLGNAERLLARYADRIRFCPAIGWLLWDGRRWKVLMHSRKGDHLAVMQLAMKTIRRFKEQCVDIADQKLAARAFKHALSSEGLFRLEAMVELAKGSVRIDVEQLDQDAHLLNVANGTLDLRTGQLRAFDRNDYLTRVIPVEYHPEALAPTWTKFLDTIMAGNVNLIGFLQRGVGYSLTGLLREHILFLMYGVGANGKSTFLGTIHDVLGEYAQGMAPETIMAKKHEGMPNDIARMRGARFISALETKRGRQLDESQVKKLTGGDLLTGCFKFKEYFDFKPTHKLWLGTNHKPVIKDTTQSIWRRVMLITFGVVIAQPDQDTGLKDALLAEAPGILAWAVEGCAAWQRDGLRAPDEVLADTEQYRQEQDSLAEFVKLKLEVWPRAWATVADIYKAYEEWADEDGGPEHSGEGRLSSRDVTSYLVSTYALSRGDKKVDHKAHKALFGIRLSGRRSPKVTMIPEVSRNENPLRLLERR